jgi:hypothetical protein
VLQDISTAPRDRFHFAADRDFTVAHDLLRRAAFAEWYFSEENGGAWPVRE